MEPAVLVIVRYEIWIYALLLVAAIYYVRLFRKGRRALRTTVFGLEKEIARAQVVRAVSLLLLIAVVGVSVYYTALRLRSGADADVLQASNADVAPVVIYGTLAPIDFPSPTPGPPPQPAADASPFQRTGGTPPPLALKLDTTGCLNPDATLAYPTQDARVSSTVEVIGTANIPDFAFYKFEIAGYATAGDWITLSANDTPVVEGRLGIWDTSAYAPGLYAFRLVVVDRSGRSPLPCAVAVEVLPGSVE